MKLLCQIQVKFTGCPTLGESQFATLFHARAGANVGFSNYLNLPHADGWECGYAVSFDTSLGVVARDPAETQPFLIRRDQQ
eukprot:m.9994 g.9994  ORF g.9994 m.9994 type:complete len:81 (+) comp4257_c0_seq1:1426-1668(+)